MLSGIQVAQGQERLINPLDNYTQDQSTNKLEYITGQNTNGRKRGMDVVVYGSYSVSIANTVEAGSTKRVIKKTAHNARANDFIQFTSGPSDGVAIQILSCPDANTMILAANSEFAIAVGNQFDIKRYITPQYSPDGSLNVTATQGPTKFTKDTVATEVQEDTLDPSNNVLFPVKFIKNIKEPLFVDYAVKNVDDGAFVEIVTATTVDTKSMTWFESGGYAMVLAIGAVGFEVPVANIPPGGFNGEIPLEIPAGSRLSLKCLEAGKESNVGIIIANFIG